MSQFVVPSVPLNMPLLVIVQPAPVWRVIESLLWELTPSMMSISPELGQLGPTVQLREVSKAGEEQLRTYNAGHVPQTPPGM